MITKTPTFNWKELHGKEIKIMYTSDTEWRDDGVSGVKVECVIGYDKNTGVSYVLHTDKYSVRNEYRG